MTIELATALAPIVPKLAEQYVAALTRTIEPIIAARAAGTAYDKNQWRRINQYIVRGEPGMEYHQRQQAAERVNTQRLQAAADQFALDAVANAQAKLTEKLQGAVTLDGIRVHAQRGTGLEFSVAGALADGRRVVMHQQGVLKFTQRGLPFYQWPARLRVEGRPTTAHAFKKMVAA